jgi:hypothetical protein
MLALLRGRASGADEARPPALGSASTITIRPSNRSDEPAIERLGRLSERDVPAGRFVVAEVDGKVWAVHPLTGGEPFGDPFLPAFEVKELLSLRVAQLGDEDDGGLARREDNLVVARPLIESR